MGQLVRHLLCRPGFGLRGLEHHSLLDGGKVVEVGEI
jgi:hypothetical protein